MPGPLGTGSGGGSGGGVTSVTAGNGITVTGTTTPTIAASLAAGTGIGISGTTTLSVSNTGVTSLVAGSGISVSSATGAVTVSASGGSGGSSPVLIGRTILSTAATAITFSSIPSGYKHYKLLYGLRGDFIGATVTVYIRLNGDTAYNYRRDTSSYSYMYGVTIGASTSLAPLGHADILLLCAGDTQNYTTGRGDLNYTYSTNTNYTFGAYSSTPTWLSTARVTQVSLTAISNNLIANSFAELWGYP